MTPATTVCFCVIILLTLIQVRPSLFSSIDLFHVERNQDFMANRTDYIEFGQARFDVCGTLSQLMNGKKLEDLNQVWHRAITQLTTWVVLAIHILITQTTLSAQNCGGYPRESRREPLKVR